MKWNERLSPFSHRKTTWKILQAIIYVVKSQHRSINWAQEGTFVCVTLQITPLWCITRFLWLLQQHAAQLYSLFVSLTCSGKMIVFGSVAATNASDDKQLLLWLTAVQRLTCSLWNTGNRHRSKHLQNSSQLEVKVPPVWCCRQIYTSATKTKSWRIWFFLPVLYGGVSGPHWK